MGLFGNVTDKLFKAAAAGDAEAVARYAGRGGDVNARNAYGRTPLTLAVSNGKPENERAVLAVVAALLARKADVNLADTSGNTALILASWKGLAKVVDALLGARVKVDCTNKEGNSALIWASIQGHTKIVAKLLAANADVDLVGPGGKTALHFAGSKGHASVVRALLEAGADPDAVNDAGRTTFDQAERVNQPLVARLLRDSSFRDSSLSSSSSRRSSVLSASSLSDTYLHDPTLPSAPPAEMESPPVSASMNFDLELVAAAQDGDINRVKFSLQQGADVNTTDANGATPLLLAAERGHSAVVDFLLLAKAAVDCTNGVGDSALTSAAASGHAAVVLKLLGAGASIHVVNSFGETALSLALQNGHVDVLRELVDCVESIASELDANGRTLIHRATASPQSRDVVEFVASLNGIDVNATDDNGETALQIAVARDNDIAISALLRRGAIVDNAVILAAVSPSARATLLHHNYELFNEQCVALLNQPESPTVEEIRPLIPLVTSVYDMRWLMTLFALVESFSSRAELLRAAFDHIITLKLVFDTAACAFFKMMIESCRESQWMPKLELIHYDRQAENVNTESAEWVTELKRRVSENTWRLDAHEKCLKQVVDGVREVHAMVMENRNTVQAAMAQIAAVQQQVNAGKRLHAQLAKHTSEVVQQLHYRLEQCENNVVHVASSLQSFCVSLENRQHQEKRNKKIKMMCSVVASVAGFVLAPVVKEIADAVVDLTNPIEIVQYVYGEMDIAQFLANASEKKLNEKIRNQLEAFAISTEEFEILLREEIALQHPRFLDECEERKLVVDLDGGRGDTAIELAPVLEKEQSTVLDIIAELRIALSVVNPAALQRVDSLSADDWRTFDDTVEPQGLEDEASRESSPDNEDLNVVAGTQRDVVMFVEDAEAFPFHEAVHNCDGDLDKFLTSIEKLQPTVNDAASPMQMRLCSVATYREALCAAQYAYCLGHRDVGDFLASRMETPPASFTTGAMSVTLVEDADHVPYFEIIDESQGDITRLEHYLDLIDMSECPLDTTVTVDAVRVRSSTSLSWSAAEYASHLGYVDVVKHLLKTLGKQVPIKERLRLVNHALQQQQAAHGA